MLHITSLCRVAFLSREFAFLRPAREELSHIHMGFSKIPAVRKRFIEENGLESINIVLYFDDFV